MLGIEPTVAEADYFDALEIPLLSGRMFGAEDSEKAPRVAIVNEAFARKFGLGREAVGKRLDPRLHRLRGGRRWRGGSDRGWRGRASDDRHPPTARAAGLRGPCCRDRRVVACHEHGQRRCPRVRAACHRWLVRCRGRRYAARHV